MHTFFMINTLKLTSKLVKKCSSLKNDSRIIFVRHGQSIFNKACDEQAERLGINKLQWSQQAKNQEFCKNVCYNAKYADCGLTSKGIKQSQGLATEIKKNFKIDLVLVSPLNRTLQTCMHAVSDKNIPVVVEPLLAQSCRFSCDILKPGNLKQKRDKYSRFDFQGLVQKKYAYNVPSAAVEKCDKLFPSLSQKERWKILMKMIEQNQLFENDRSLRERAWKVKQFLADKSRVYKNILVISHWYILTSVLSKQFSADHQNLNYIDIQNCRPYSATIEELLQVR